MNRIKFLKLAAISGLMVYKVPGLVAKVNQENIYQLPMGLKAVMDSVLSKEPGFWNTDWNGAMVIESLMGWNHIIDPNAIGYAKNWFDFHIANDHKLSDGGFYDTYPGPRSRIIHGKYLPLSMYSGFFCFTLSLLRNL